MWCTERDQNSDVFLKYYSELFSSSEPEPLMAELASIAQVVTEEMNDILIGDFKAWEVEVALKQMARLKAPGPDGMPPLFYQKFWDLVSSDVTNTVLHFLNKGSLPNSLNHTFITLIPKTKKLEICD